MRLFFCLLLLLFLCSSGHAQGIVIDLVGAGVGNQPIGDCDSGLPFPDCTLHDGNQTLSVAPQSRYGVYFEWTNNGAATFAEVRATDQLGNPVFPTVTDPLPPGASAKVTHFLEAPATPGVYDFLVTITAADENDREDTESFRYFLTVDVSLPVTWEDVRAESHEKGTVDLSWVVSSEAQNEGFTVERSQGGDRFLTVGMVDGNAAGQELNDRSGRHYPEGTYHFRDVAAPEGALLYRIRQRDFDGAETVSPVVSITVEAGLRVFPNPAYERLFVRGVADRVVTIFDVTGKRIGRYFGVGENGIDLDGLRPGQYWVRVDDQVLPFVNQR